MFGFTAVTTFTHEAETVLDQVRTGVRQIDAQLISALLDYKDHTAQLISHCLHDQSTELPEALAIQSSAIIKRLASHQDISHYTTNVTEPQCAVEGGGSLVVDDCWLISLEFKASAFRNGIDPLSFIRYLQTLGDIKQILTLAPAMPTGEAMTAEDCYLHFKIAFFSTASKKDIESVFDFASDDCTIKILPPNTKVEDYLTLMASLDTDHVSRLGEILVQVGALTQNDVDQALLVQAESTNQKKPLGEILLGRAVVQPEVVEHALKVQDQTKQKLANEANYIRIDSGKLSYLINLIGELVTNSAAMNLIVERHGLSDDDDIALTMNNLVNNIRDTALELRMVQIGSTFTRFKRTVRDVSQSLNKDIELYISGGETELDKSVVEKINDPLMHLLRNALDHGIETPSERLAAGKSPQGVVKLNAFHQSGHIVIQIEDDGAGLNSQKILAKAIANGLVSKEQQLSKQEIYNLIFAAGLSTKDQASDLSGRGVGMDVVKRNIEALRGTVSIDSEEGQGTLITLQLPLTLAIIDGFMVSTGVERYIIPLSSVVECVELSELEHEINATEHYINLRGEVLPYLRLADFFQNPQKSKQKRESIVVIKSGKSKIGLVVDQLHGEHQTVIKPLGKVFEKLKSITGATVLGDGNVALILDVQILIQMAIKNKTKTKQFKQLLADIA